MSRRIAVIGLGYVGLPIAVAFGKKQNVIGFDINEKRIKTLQANTDYTKEVSEHELLSANITYTSDPNYLHQCNFIIVTVPTPIDEANKPDLTSVIKASETVGYHLSSGTIVVFESTVYPGTTEEICLPLLEACSGLKAGLDFRIGYSPERINPGDRVHTFENIIKVVSGQDDETLNEVAMVYEQVVKAGVYKAPSIKVAEAAKIIENTQRDLNIALMNELAMIFDRMNIRTVDVLQAAETKWNFLKFTPGLVGGHCIGVDPYYLTYKAEELGYNPQVILAGRRINDGMGKYIAEKTVKQYTKTGKNLNEAKIAILGLTFKENVPDLRNSRVPDILKELNEYGVKAQVHDPLANPEEAWREYNINLVSWEELFDLDVIILAVPHQNYMQIGVNNVLEKFNIKGKGVLVDVKSALAHVEFSQDIFYWSL